MRNDGKAKGKVLTLLLVFRDVLETVPCRATGTQPPQNRVDLCARDEGTEAALGGPGRRRSEGSLLAEGTGAVPRAEDPMEFLEGQPTEPLEWEDMEGFMSPPPRQSGTYVRHATGPRARAHSADARRSPRVREPEGLLVTENDENENPQFPRRGREAYVSPERERVLVSVSPVRLEGRTRRTTARNPHEPPQPRSTERRHDRSRSPERRAEGRQRSTHTAHHSRSPEPQEGRIPRRSRPDREARRSGHVPRDRSPYADRNVSGRLDGTTQGVERTRGSNHTSSPKIRARSPRSPSKRRTSSRTRDRPKRSRRHSSEHDRSRSRRPRRGRRSPSVSDRSPDPQRRRRRHSSSESDGSRRDRPRHGRHSSSDSSTSRGHSSRRRSYSRHRNTIVIPVIGTRITEPPG